MNIFDWKEKTQSIHKNFSTRYYLTSLTYQILNIKIGWNQCETMSHACSHLKTLFSTPCINAEYCFYHIQILPTNMYHSDSGLIQSDWKYNSKKNWCVPRKKQSCLSILF